ncbi:MAG: ketoacyl-ACP synthase III [Lentisphaerae bacterium]|nr:ketoacyl-ACP synthase III [Lentisphaerota bacterium]
MNKGVVITGTGSYLPERILTNQDLEKMVDTSDEWISTRTGIKERHIAADNESASDMGAKAALRAIENAGKDIASVEMIIVATSTPDMLLPGTACFVQEEIGAKKAFCFDLGAACSGFLYAMEVARQFIAQGTINTALVIGAEKMSCVVDWEDRSTCVLFGDGAGAAVLENGGDVSGIKSSVLGSDGALTDLLNIPGGGSRNPVSHRIIDERLPFIKMEGKEVFKNAVRYMCDAGQQALERSGFTIDDIECVIPHQANMRIISAISDRIGAPLDRFYVNVDRVGNMSAASVPVALDEAVRNGRIKKGDKVLFVAFGGGFTWGATVIEWTA